MEDPLGVKVLHAYVQTLITLREIDVRPTVTRKYSLHN